MSPAGAFKEPLISIRGLRYRYVGSERDVLRIPALDVTGTGLIALTGPSGAGKTTLVELLAGTLREEYDGSVRALGVEWKSLKRDADRQRHLRRIGLIPQDFGLLPQWTVWQTVEQALVDADIPKEELAQRVYQALEMVNLVEFGSRRISGLSGGQGQRVAIARVLARDVELVIADEPTANLDPQLVDATLSLFRKLAGRVPVVIVTHDPHVAELCDRTIVLQSAADAPEAITEPLSFSRRPQSTVIMMWGALAGCGVIAVLAGAAVVTAARMNHRAEGVQSPIAQASAAATSDPHAAAATSSGATGNGSAPVLPIPRATTLASSLNGAALSPTEAVTRFYSLMSQHQWETAYQMLSARNQAASTYDHWVAGYRTTQSVTVETASEVSNSPETVEVTFIATDLTSGSTLIRLFTDTWTLVPESGQWHLDVEHAVQSAPVASTSTPTGQAELQTALDTVQRQGYRANDVSTYAPRLPLHVVVGTAADSADGRNQRAFFFVGSRYLGPDTYYPSAGIKVLSQDESTVTLAYSLYKPQDPMCCPSGGSAAVRFHWDGQKLAPLDYIPSEDVNATASRR